MPLPRSLCAVSSTESVVVGRIGPAHGIRGEVYVEPRTDEPERRFAAGTRFETERGPLTVTSTRTHQGRLLVRFEELPDRTAAEGMRGLLLDCEIDPQERPEDPEEFYDHQLVGLLAVRDSGAEIGPVTSVTHGAQDLLVIDAGGHEVLVPFVTALVPEVDVAGGRVVVRDLPGLIDDLDED